MNFICYNTAAEWLERDIKKKITDRLFLNANDGTMSRWNQNSELLQEREGSKYVVTLLVTERNK